MSQELRDSQRKQQAALDKLRSVKEDKLRELKKHKKDELEKKKKEEEEERRLDNHDQKHYVNTVVDATPLKTHLSWSTSQ